MSEVKYKRVLLKLSGEALQDTQDHQILQATTLKNAACAVKKMVDKGVQVAIVAALEISGVEKWLIQLELIQQQLTIWECSEL